MNQKRGPRHLPNSTQISSSVSSSTASSTTTTTIINFHASSTTAAAHAASGNIEWLYGVLVIVVIAVLYMMRMLMTSGSTRPAWVLWLFHNYSATQFRIKEDLRGIFIYVYSKGIRPKQAETLKKTGLPFEVSVLPQTVAYFLDDDGYANVLPDYVQDELIANGFKITQRPLEQISRGGISGLFGKKWTETKGYLVEKETAKTRLAYIDVNESRTKMSRLYVAVEGLGETVELLDTKNMVDQAKTKDPGNSGLIQEERSAVKELLHIWATELRGRFSDVLLPMGTGAGLMAIVILLLELITGHIH